ncbi:hypothetical protein D7Y15_32830 [Corallococcus sp. AB030]|nr:hypothetical protein D7Y15_32830 [Corallococcus sp. AB030]
MLWILRTGAHRNELLREEYPPRKTVNRWSQGWGRDETLRAVLRALAQVPLRWAPELPSSRRD